MGAATRSSTATAVDALAAIKRPVAELGEQLLAAARALASSNPLLVVLSDHGVPAEQRSALAQKAVGATLSLQARGLLGLVAGSRWSTQSDLVGGVEELGIRALTMPSTADGVEAELFTVRQAITSDGPLELALGGQSTPIAVRLALVDTLLKDAKPETRAIVRHVVQLPRGRKPVEAIDAARDLAAEARGQLLAVVETARPLTAQQQATLAARLEAGYGRKIALNELIDPTLVAGVRITVGDDVIDGTVRARLDDLRLQLAR